MSQTLTEALAEKIFTALAIAESEAGEEQYYDDVRSALYDLFPSLKGKHEAIATARKASAEEQCAARKEITDECIGALDQAAPLLPQIRRFFSTNYANRRLSDHFSDGICLAADIWRYATPEVIGQLVDEVQTKDWLGLADLLEGDSFEITQEPRSGVVS
ncbi:MAG: hypothetical protein JRN21_09465 [Nitrososphaerota archaeon]|nr:hypothetical protein [Nitrososphaerota archaeon]